MVAPSMQASVRPAEASADTSTWVLLGHDSTGRSGLEHTLQAGQEVCVEVALCDAYGNLAGDFACVRSVYLYLACLICHSCCWACCKHLIGAKPHMEMHDSSHHVCLLAVKDQRFVHSLKALVEIFVGGCITQAHK